MVIMIKTMRRWYLRGRFSSRVGYKGGLFCLQLCCFLMVGLVLLVVFLVRGGVVKWLWYFGIRR